MLRKCIGKLNIPNFIHDFGEFKKKSGISNACLLLCLFAPVWIY